MSHAKAVILENEGLVPMEAIDQHRFNQALSQVKSRWFEQRMAQPEQAQADWPAAEAIILHRLCLRKTVDQLAMWKSQDARNKFLVSQSANDGLKSELGIVDSLLRD